MARQQERLLNRTEPLRQRRMTILGRWIVRADSHLLRFPPLHHQEDPRLDGLVFYGERAGPVRCHSFRKVWDRACAAAGVEGARSGWLRHSGASVAYAASHDLKAVAQRLGHTSVRMVDGVYVHLYDETSRELADVIDALVDGASRARDGTTTGRD